MQIAVVFFLPFLYIVWFHSSSEQENLNFYEIWGKSHLTFSAEYLTDSYESNRFTVRHQMRYPKYCLFLRKSVLIDLNLEKIGPFNVFFCW